MSKTRYKRKNYIFNYIYLSIRVRILKGNYLSIYLFILGNILRIKSVKLKYLMKKNSNISLDHHPAEYSSTKIELLRKDRYYSIEKSSYLVSVCPLGSIWGCPLMIHLLPKKYVTVILRLRTIGENVNEHGLFVTTPPNPR